MRRSLKILTAATAVCSMSVLSEINRPKFSDDGSILRPTDHREWVFVGSPLTPNALNNGAASFQEFHNVYVENSAFQHFKKTGLWGNGTQIVMELVSVRQGNDCDEETGACIETSGTGYFQGDFNGLTMAVKDTERFPSEPGGWVYYIFGNSQPPYADTAKEFPAAACNACHDAAADTDFVFTQYYPVLRTLPVLNQNNESAMKSISYEDLSWIR
ncbi:cytochrome P460 family protein [Algicola sagamiensis]|uniref:cytochrome P460 family protein n=1 Tax=Algicola sagamiensis TaxID=163869 RepID=UPI0003615618|nr:cytochrome P460 family protein [Algicola sagamiensis]